MNPDELYSLNLKLNYVNTVSGKVQDNSKSLIYY